MQAQAARKRRPLSAIRGRPPLAPHVAKRGLPVVDRSSGFRERPCRGPRPRRCLGSSIAITPHVASSPSYVSGRCSLERDVCVARGRTVPTYAGCPASAPPRFSPPSASSPRARVRAAPGSPRLRRARDGWAGRGPSAPLGGRRPGSRRIRAAEAREGETEGSATRHRPPKSPSLFAASAAFVVAVGLDSSVGCCVDCWASAERAWAGVPVRLAGLLDYLSAGRRGLSSVHHSPVELSKPEKAVTNGNGSGRNDGEFAVARQRSTPTPCVSLRKRGSQPTHRAGRAGNPNGLPSPGLTKKHSPPVRGSPNRIPSQRRWREQNRGKRPKEEAEGGDRRRAEGENDGATSTARHPAVPTPSPSEEEERKKEGN
ncbi:hypothetical protein THAOC_11281, partial [Thalassiosira oceanica]